MKRDTDLVIELAKKFNLSLTAFGEKIHTVDGPSYGSLELTDAWNTALEPAPVTPIGLTNGPYKLFSGTIIATYKASPKFKAENKQILVAPAALGGNTGQSLD